MLSPIWLGAQFGFQIGSGAAGVLTQQSTGTYNPTFSISHGVLYQYSPFQEQSPFRFENRFGFNVRGYSQKYDQSKVTVKLIYLSVDWNVLYIIKEKYTPFLGIQYSYNLNRQSYYERGFLKNDLGINAGMNIKMNRYLTFFTQVYSGVVPIIEHDDISDYGVYNGRRRSVHNWQLLLGFKLKIE